MSTPRLYLVWDNTERGAWHRTGGWGYTLDVREAARYPEAEAQRIVARANIADEPGAAPNTLMMLEPSGSALLPSAVHDLAAQRDDAELARWLVRAALNPGSIAGRRRSPSWGKGAEGYAEHEESMADWVKRAVERVLAKGGRPHCERCCEVIRIDDAYDPPLPGVGLWEHAGDCPPRVAPNGCDDCSVEPGERHRHAGCPGNLRAIARAGRR